MNFNDTLTKPKANTIIRNKHKHTDAEIAHAVWSLRQQGLSNKDICNEHYTLKTYAVTHYTACRNALTPQQMKVWNTHPKRITLGHIRAISSQDAQTVDKAITTLLSRKIASKKLLAACKSTDSSSAPNQNADIASYTQEMSDKLGRVLKIQDGKPRGTLSIEFYGFDDLENILESLSP